MNPAGISVLIVDDDRVIAHMLKGLLNKVGHELAHEPVWAASGAQTYAALKSQRFDLVLLDFSLPDSDGLSILANIQEIPQQQRPVVIMLTASGNETIAVEALRHGAKDYFVKSAMNLPLLQQAIAGALHQKRLEQELNRSFAEQKEMNDQMREELVMAREVQAALLPQRYPAFPAGTPRDKSRLRFGHRWVPSSGVSGDFFQVFAISDGAAGIFLCDVMGHGVRAALITAVLRGLMEELKDVSGSPDLMMWEVNRAIQSILERSNDLLYATAFYLVADVANNQLLYTSAGHPAPLILRRASGEVTPLKLDEGPGTAVGLVADSVYTTSVCPWSPGDAVLLFTDGLCEAQNEKGEEVGDARLCDIAKTNLSFHKEALCDAMISGVKKFCGEAVTRGFDDDLCLVAVEYAPE